MTSTPSSNVGADASHKSVPEWAKVSERYVADWLPIETAPEGVPVLTKIDDEHGPRNEAVLKRKGRLWWTTDEAIYVYYEPTHWADAGESK